jgi:hypothetical protein
MSVRGDPVLLAILVIVSLVQPVRAAADHAGRVTLANGVPVPGARVTASQGDQRVVTSTDRQGIYRLPGLVEGTWAMQVEMVGFSTQTREVIVAADAVPSAWELSVLPFAEITKGIPMPPPSPSADVARGAAPARAESRATAGGPRESGAPAPPAGGSFQRAGVAATSPGGTPASAAAAAAGLAAGRPPAPILPPGDAGGAPTASGDSLLVSGTVNSGSAPQPSVGNVRRVTGIRLFSGQVTVSGNNSALDARPYSLTGIPARKPDTSRLTLNGIFSGPIRIPGLMRTTRNLLVQYGRNASNDASTLSELMPTLLQRGGDFSQTIDGFGQPVQLIDPATGLPFPGNVIPPERISPQAAALLGYFPLPEPGAVGAYNYQIPALSTNTTHNVTVSMSNLVNNTTNLIGVNGSYNRSSSDSTSLFGFDNSSHGSGVSATLNWTRRLLPSNQQIRMRHTYTRQTNTSVPQFANTTNVSGDAGIAGNNQDPVNWGPPSLSFSSGVAALSDSQYSFNRTQSHSFGADTTRTRGRHNMSVGGSARYQMLDIVSQQNARGAFTFNGSFSGYDFADFLLGIPNTSSIAYGNADKGFRAWTFDAYFNNDFRVSPSFTMNVGVRWEFEAPVAERFGRLVNLDVAQDFSAAAPVIAADGVGPITGRRYPDSLIRSNPLGIQPRFGVAWRPVPTSSVVLRAGYGIYRNTSVYQTIARQMAQQPPLSRTFNAVNTPETPLTLADGFVAPISTTLNTVAYDPDFRVGTIHRWQASTQRDLPGGLTVVGTYLAGKGVNLPQAFIPNTYPAGAPNPCPSCPTGFVYTTSGGSSIQHAGQFEVRRRLRGGLTWTAAYTLTKATDNTSGGGGGGGSVAQNWLDLAAERGPSSSEQRHQFRLTAQYSTGQGVSGGALRTGVMGALVNGWTVSPSITAGSGTPRTPVYSVASVAGVTGTVRADLTGAPIDAAPDGYYANPGAFAPPAPGTWGTAARNSIRGPGSFSFNAGLTRQFPLRNRLSLNWTISATNILNRVTYSSINTTVGSSQFGLPIATSGMRRITTSLSTRF